MNIRASNPLHSYLKLILITFFTANPFAIISTAEDLTDNKGTTAKNTPNTMKNNTSRISRSVFIDPETGDRLSADDPRIQQFRSNSSFPKTTRSKTATTDEPITRPEIVESDIPEGGQYLKNSHKVRSRITAITNKNRQHIDCKVNHRH